VTNNVVELLNRRLRRGQDHLGVVINDAAAHRDGAGAWRPLSAIIAREGAIEVDRVASIVAQAAAALNAPRTNRGSCIVTSSRPTLG
jgi:hypothetical protein